ncbi:hypothetical protein HanIR_Chr16g0818181 [Helianthus annuus]|nr:hypothetical protein HanIR_Chr16g0818181 [Helianthus annuus]
MMRAVILELKDIPALYEIRRALDKRGYGEYPVSYLGGLKCMVVLKEKGQAIRLTMNNGEEWEKIVTSAELWKGQDLIYERLLWVRINGVPIHLRDAKTYNDIGGCFGRVVGLSEFSWNDNDNSDSGCWVVTENGKFIEEEVNLQWNDKEYRVWVREEQNSSLKMVISELSIEGKESPAKTSGSAAAPADGMEEGEIRNDAVGGENAEDHAWGTEPSTPMHEVHGKQEREKLNVAAGMYQHINGDGETWSTRNVEAGNQEPNVDLGPGPNTKSRKRPRRNRSPQDMSPDIEIQEDPSRSHIKNLERSFDLNNEMASVDVCIGEQERPDTCTSKIIRNDEPKEFGGKEGYAGGRGPEATVTVEDGTSVMKSCVTPRIFVSNDVLTRVICLHVASIINKGLILTNLESI